MAKKKKIPEIRFKEFTDSWSDQPLSYYLAVSEEKNSANQYDKYDIYSVSREYGVINQIEYQGKSFAGASLLNYRVVNPNEVVYTKSPLRAQPYGIIKTNKSDSGIVSALYGVFKPNEEVDPIFVQTYFELDSRLNEYLRPLVNKGAKNTLLISDEDSISGNVSFPKKEEQEKMVKLFTAIDKLIRKLEEKLEKLKNIKQSLLNQMFTDVNRGGWIPKIRFAGFNENWEMITLGDISHYIDRKAPSNSNAPVMMITASHGFIEQSERYSSDNAGQSLSNYTLLKEGEMAYNHGFSKLRNFGSIFDLRVSEARVPFVYHCFSLPEDNPMFYSYYLNSGLFARNLRKMVTSTARMDGLLNISYETFMELPCTRPTKDEQAELADFFCTIEKFSNETDAKLVEIRKMKQALLNKMFVN